MSPIRVLLAVLLLATSAFIARGDDPTLQTLTFADQHCAITIPKAWTQKPTTYLVEAHRAGGGTLLLMGHPSAPGFHIDDPVFAATIKNKLIQDGHEIVSEDHAPFQGHAAYSYTMRKTIAGFPIYTHAIFFVADGFSYQIATSLKNSDPTKDPELTAAANSFQLLSGKASAAQ